MTSENRWNLVYYILKTWNLTGGAAVAVMIGGILLCIIIPYLLGSFNFGLIISKKKYHDDIRMHGSGNAGTTNMLRTYGPGAAVLTLIGDMAKAALAVGLGYLIFNYQADIYNEAGKWVGVYGDKTGAAIAGLFVMLGHMFPCFYHFKGGKGVATTGMVILMLNPLVFLILLAIFIIIVVFTRYVSLASVMGVCLCPIILSAFEQSQGSYTASGLAVIMAVFVVYMHRENIKRIKDGKESKISFKKKKDSESVQEAGTVPHGVGQAPGKEASGNESSYETGQKASRKSKPEDPYTYVHCTGCGSLIPCSRKVCAYCDTVNVHYAPEEAPKGGKPNGTGKPQTEKKKRK